MKRLILITAMALCLAPATATAEWIFTPFIGTSFAAGTDNIDYDYIKDQSKLTYGGTLTFVSSSAFGFEIDLGYSPEYFEDNDGDIDLVDSSNYTSLMANLVISAPRGAFRPYGTAGVGFLKTTVDDIEDAFDVDRNALGFNLGGGIIAFFTDRIGIRGDVRYFRQMTEADDDEVDFDVTSFRFWRGTVGVSFRF